jgi:hypothetical protein
MVSLHDASRRLRIPVEVLWTWIADGTLAAHVKPGRGFGMEYFLDTDQLRMAREVRDSQNPHEPRRPSEEDMEKFPQADNIIPFDFGDAHVEQRQPETVIVETDTYRRSSALIAMENLRNDTLAALQRQAQRENALLEMVDAVDMVLTTTLKAMARAQDVNQARLAAELESVRSRLADRVREREQEDAALEEEMARTKAELLVALKDVNPNLDFDSPDSIAKPRQGASHAAESIEHDSVGRRDA